MQPSTQPRRLWIANSRSCFRRMFTRRSARLLRRTVLLVFLLTLAFVLLEYKRAPADRLVNQDMLREAYARSVRPRRHDPRTWPGWRGVERIFAFGDSNTDSGFNELGPQPDSVNPLGNPAWPGRTASYGPNYLGHLTATFNQSFIKTYNLAQRGSTFEPRVDENAPPSLYQQIELKFIKRYGVSTKKTMQSSRGSGDWGMTESLFLLYPGVDDLLFNFRLRNGGRNETVITAYIDTFQRCIELLYLFGARNFVFINLPQLEESPFMRTADIKGGIFALGADIVQYNGRLAFMAHRFAETHPDASLFIFNNHDMSLRVKDDPGQYVETETIQKVEGYCYPYAESKWWAATKDVYDDLCTYPLDGYLWRDDYHHTEPYHKLMARLIVEHVSNPKNRLPFEFY